MTEQAHLNGDEGTEDGDKGGEEISFVPKFLLERFLAKLIDFLIMGAFFAFPTFVGPVAGTTYILISDGLRGGQSLGKRIIGLRVVSSHDWETPCDFKLSIIRNAVFGILVLWYFLVRWIPYLGVVLVVALWAAVLAAEMILIYADEEGARFGDRIANTRIMPAS